MSRTQLSPLSSWELGSIRHLAQLTSTDFISVDLLRHSSRPARRAGITAEDLDRVKRRSSTFSLAFHAIRVFWGDDFPIKMTPLKLTIAWEAAEST